MSAHAGQKRSAASQAASSSKSHQQKKTRFVDPEEDPTKFEEQVDAALEGPARKGRRVRNEGYDSDSTDDGESVVKNRGKGEGQDDEEDDMFAMADEKKDDDVKGKAPEKFMRLGDIEGQEFGNTRSGSEGDDDDEDDDDEPEDQDDAERRKKAGMGFELSSFNMREEMEEGKFTEDGMYVRTFDPHGTHDKWMEGLSEREIKQARRRKKERDRAQQEKQDAEERELLESGGKPSLEKELIPLLRKGESILEALQRLNSKNKKNPSRSHRSKPQTTPGQSVNAEKAPAASNPVEEITSLASRLMSLGDTDIYSKTYEELVRSVRASGTVDKDWEPPSADPKYEYKWATPEAGQTSEIFGPFGDRDLKAWFNAAYFGVGGEKILVRQVGGEWGSWDDIVER